VIVCEPALSVEMDVVATPLAFNMPDPIGVLPSRKITLPVASAGRVAVNVSAFPYVEGLTEDVKVIVAWNLFTVWDIGRDVTLA
jgi:hypothetical protein